MKEEYVLRIVKLLHKCDDVEIFEIILHLLQKYSQLLCDNRN